MFGSSFSFEDFHACYTNFHEIPEEHRAAILETPIRELLDVVEIGGSRRAYPMFLTGSGGCAFRTYGELFAALGPSHLNEAVVYDGERLTVWR